MAHHPSFQEHRPQNSMEALSHSAAAAGTGGANMVDSYMAEAYAAAMNGRRTHPYDVAPGYGGPQAANRRPSLRGGIGGPHQPDNGAAQSLQTLMALQGQAAAAAGGGAGAGVALSPAERQQFENAMAVAQQQQLDMYTRSRRDSSSPHYPPTSAAAGMRHPSAAAYQAAVAGESSLYDRSHEGSPRGSFSFSDLPREYQAAVSEFHARFRGGDHHAIAAHLRNAGLPPMSRASFAAMNGDDHLPKIEREVARLALSSPTTAAVGGEPKYASSPGGAPQFSGDSPPTVHPHPHGGGHFSPSATPPLQRSHSQQHYAAQRSASAPHGAALSPELHADNPIIRSPSSQSQPPAASSYMSSRSAQHGHHSSNSPVSAHDYSFDPHSASRPSFYPTSPHVASGVSPSRHRADSSMTSDSNVESMKRGTKRSAPNGIDPQSNNGGGNANAVTMPHALQAAARTAASVAPDEDMPSLGHGGDSSSSLGVDSMGGDNMEAKTTADRERFVIAGAVSDDGPAASSSSLSSSSMPDTDLARAMFRPTQRKKTNRACESCRKAKTRCDEARPCHRCQRLGKKDCVDRPLTKRHRSHPQRDPISFLSSFSDENLPGRNTLVDLPVLSDEDHARHVADQGLAAVRSLDWSSLPRDIVSTLVPFMVNGSCSDVDEQRTIIQQMAVDYNASLTLEADRSEGESNSADPLFEYVPDYLVEEFPFPILRSNLRVASQRMSLEMKFRFSRFLPEMLGYSHEELAQMQRNGQGRLFHHDDWADFLRRAFQRARVNQNDLFSTTAMVRLRKRDGTYIRACQVTHVSLSMSQSSWASFLHFFAAIAG